MITLKMKKTPKLVVADLFAGAGGASAGLAESCQRLGMETQLVAGGQHMGLCQPFITTCGGPVGQGRNPHSINEPMPTVLTEDHSALIQPLIMSMEHGHKPKPFIIPTNHGTTQGGGHRVYDPSKPMPTLTTVDAWGLVEPFLVSYYGTQNMSRTSQPVPTITTKDRFGLVQCGGGLGLNIFFRMLHWRELANAHSFPEKYQFCGTREQIVKQIGNSWAVEEGAALCGELVKEYAYGKAA